MRAIKSEYEKFNKYRRTERSIAKRKAECKKRILSLVKQMDNSEKKLYHEKIETILKHIEDGKERTK